MSAGRGHRVGEGVAAQDALHVAGPDPRRRGQVTDQVVQLPRQNPRITISTHDSYALQLKLLRHFLGYI